MTDDRKLDLKGTTYKVKLGTEQTNQQFALIEAKIVPGGEVGLHIHDKQSETFIVKKGKFWFQVGGSEFVLEEGEVAYGPPNLPHAWKNIGDGLGIIYFLFTPGTGHEEFYDELQSLVDAEGTMGDLKLLQKKYGIQSID